jgi:hypothetical protein
VQVELFGQCGGRTSLAGVNGSDAAFCCPAGSQCSHYSVDYWQCQPPAYKAPPEPPATFNCSFGQTQVRETKARPGQARLGGGQATSRRLLIAHARLAQVSKWSACGGVSSTGLNASDPTVCCPVRTECQFYDVFFWQCAPLGWVAQPKPVGTWAAGCAGTKASVPPLAADTPMMVHALICVPF